MIQRIALFKLNAENAQGGPRAQIAARTREVLAGLPQVRAIEVGLPADEAAERSWDLSIVLRFDSLEDAEAFRVDPAHRAYADEYMRPRVEVVKAWNFEISAD